MKFLTLILACVCFHTQVAASEFTYLFFTDFPAPLDILNVSSEWAPPFYPWLYDDEEYEDDDDEDRVSFSHGYYDMVFFDLVHFAPDAEFRNMDEVSEWVLSSCGNIDDEHPIELLSSQRCMINDVEWVQIEVSTWWCTGYYDENDEYVTETWRPAQIRQYVTLLDDELYFCSFFAPTEDYPTLKPFFISTMDNLYHPANSWVDDDDDFLDPIEDDEVAL